MAERQIIIRRNLPKETRVQNSIIWDKNLSVMARFSLIAMFSLPDSWDYSVRGMAVLLGVSKDTMSKYIKELETAGYIKRTQTHGEKGTFSKSVYILTDTPGDFGNEDDLPCPKNYDTDEQCPNSSAPVTPAPVKSPQKKRTEEKKRTKQVTPKAPTGGQAFKRAQGGSGLEAGTLRRLLGGLPLRQVQAGGHPGLGQAQAGR